MDKKTQDVARSPSKKSTISKKGRLTRLAKGAAHSGQSTSKKAGAVRLRRSRVVMHGPGGTYTRDFSSKEASKLTLTEIEQMFVAGAGARALPRAKGVKLEVQIKPLVSSDMPQKAKHLADETEILKRVEEWAGSKENAKKWYRSTPLPSFGDQTAEGLVQTGRAAAVRRYLNRIALGGFA